VLEVGSGTGRMSIPLLERGVDLIGCDLSSRMLQRFQEKFPAARIAQADAVWLPFPTRQFDIVLTVHVLHLIPSWRAVLREFQRVLAPGGSFLNVSTWAPVGVSASGEMREFWRSWMQANGIDAGHPGVRDQATLVEELRSMGAELAEVEPIRFTNSFTLRDELERFESRVYSETWDLPEPIFNASMKELRAWAISKYGSLDRELENHVRFMIEVARFAA